MYVLIVVTILTTWTGGSMGMAMESKVVTMQEFSTAAACNRVAHDIQDLPKVTATCVPK